ncbi:MAG TPA: DUF2252 domain-containing protein [Alphaproteobacteria bacterium]|nr:DUF2252 domain-containing protein [Alphaproteobacteria bacterium]
MSVSRIRSSARILSVAARYDIGKKLRGKIRRADHAEWSPPASRRDPIAILVETSRHRIPELLAIRYGRMAASPFAFLRGAAAVMAADLASTRDTGLRVQTCGDCHLANFGSYESPEGNVVFDINDFDETLPAPFEWDIKRLATSIVLAGRDAGLPGKSCAAAARNSVAAYRKHMSTLVKLPPAEAWRSRTDLIGALAEIDDRRVRKREEQRLEKARGYPADGLYGISRARGKWRINDKRPLVYHFDDKRSGVHDLAARAVFANYAETLMEDRRILLDRFRLVDVAFKVVGIGSVGTFCAVGLFMTADDQPLRLQIKEAAQSVLAPYAGASVYRNQGERVVVGQRLIQAASDIFLGWTQDRKSKRDFYVRHLKNAPLANIAEEIQATALEFYARLCGRTLARAHARSGDAARISGYLGNSSAFDEAISDFAVAYADQSARDHQALLAAIKAGRMSAKAT